MPYIQVRGVDHYYQWIVEPTNKQSAPKPIMVFLHGWAGSARYWETTAQAIASQFDCLLYDLRGFGRSYLPQHQNVEIPPYEMADYAEDLAVLLDSLQLDRVYINAHSMGASVATLFLNRYPERVEKAILTCSGIFEYDEPSFSAFHKFGGYVVKFRPKWLARIPLMDKMFMARFLHRPIPTSETRAFLEDFLLADREAALGTIFSSVSKDAAETMPQEFAKIAVPVLLVSGEYDQIIPAEMGRVAAQLNELVKFALIPGTAHFPMLEDATSYLQRIQAFLLACDS